jgi:hypothetical protein
VTNQQALEGLDEHQRIVATTWGSPLCVLAGAGTGKTRALTHRIAHGIAEGHYQADQVLALTFTAKAAGEMGSRLRALGGSRCCGEDLSLRCASTAPTLLADRYWRQIARYRPVKRAPHRQSPGNPPPHARHCTVARYCRGNRMAKSSRADPRAVSGFPPGARRFFTRVGCHPKQ